MTDSNILQDNQLDSFLITSLGRFDISKNGCSLIAPSSSSKKIWELYKFMLTYRDRTFTPDSLMDQLWVDEEYSDPKGTLRIQMYRLRQLLGENNKKDDEKTLLFSNGYYKWNDQINLKSDIDDFVAAIKEGDALIKISPDEALVSYKKALQLYVGDYLPECVDQHWIFPIRNQYRRLFINAMLSTIDLLNQKKSYEDIILLCQKGIQIDTYEEIFHLNLMEALLNLGDQRKAIEYYNYITNFYDKEMGIKPSQEMRTLSKRLFQTQQLLQSQNDLQKALEFDAIIKNAFYCDPDVFKSIYELECRRNQRSGKSFSIGLITVVNKKKYTLSQKDLLIKQLREHLMVQLRKGDIFTRWNTEQLVVLLSGIDAGLTEKVICRVLGPQLSFATVSVNQINQLPLNNY